MAIPAKNLDALVVDDQEDICEVCKLYLENINIFRNVVIAIDGVDASTKLNNQTFGLILLDLKMPKKGGMEILRNLSEMPSNRFENVMVMSGEIDKTIIQDAIKLGVKHFMVKPFTQEQFEEKIKQYVSTFKK